MNKPHLLILQPMRPLVREQLSRRFTVHQLNEAPDPNAVLAEIGPSVKAIACFGGTIGPALLDRLPALEIISTSTVGYDGIDVAAAAERGVVVTNTPDVLTDEVADLALGLILATIREIPRADRYLRAGNWLKGPYRLTTTLRGRTAGIVGLGRIGKAIARRLEGFGTEIAYHGRRKQPDVGYAYAPTLLELARTVDLLVVVTPGGAETRHMINAEVLEALGKEGILINVGRGSVVDETALIAALKHGVIHSAGLDVFEDEPNVPAELMALENCVLLPHVASASDVTRDEMAQLAVDNLIAWLEERPLLTPVPETPAPARRKAM